MGNNIFSYSNSAHATAFINRYDRYYKVRMSGGKFNEIYGDTKFYKFINDKKTHYGLEMKENSVITDNGPITNKMCENRIHFAEAAQKVVAAAART